MPLLKKLGSTLFSQRLFEFFQKLGINLTGNHFFSPIPDTRALATREALWETDSELPGVDLNVKEQLHFLDSVFPRFSHECNFPLHKTSTPHEYYINNGSFGLISAAVLHCMIRHFRPKMIVEVGSGYSTLVAARASMMNQADGVHTDFVSIEPYPIQPLRKGIPGLSRLEPRNVEDIDIDFFARLEEGDILFIDSSHVIRIGGDVVFLYLEVLPRLKSGVIIHIHDIFFPKNYPKDWVLKQRRFWNEQYLLQAFLTHNRHFDVLWCGSYIYWNFQTALLSTFPPPHGLGFHENYFSSSFWMRKTGRTDRKP